ncbi:uncharacterized protein LOC132746664 [Ruditapes philippinarum]|uniref:uncharacterized protein LOC132746664 n=1 Tax=Ruditapes philippinarum TaxID=129788 RepID=UPI00295C2B68|nr:uncharacterized protein LOC132746664 [Ruditapes philippinarum]
MGCTHSTPSRTTRRKKKKRSRKKNVSIIESKEMAIKRQSAPTQAVVFHSDPDEFAAPPQNYRSEHIGVQQMSDVPVTTVSRVVFKQATYTGIYNIKVHYADHQECRIQGAQFLPNGSLIVCDQHNQTLKLWGMTFQYLAHVVLPGRPHTLCVHSSNKDGSDVYVTIPSDRTIMEFYVDGRIIIPGQKIRTDGFCYGIAPYKHGLVVGVGSKVEFIDTEGNILKVLKYSVNGASKFGSPFYLSVTGNNNIIVSDSMNRCVICVTPDGEEMFRYDEIGIPHATMTDKEENIYICGNEKGAIDVLHQLTLRGEKIKSLLSWRHVGFTPDAICYREKDKLLAVCGQSDRIKTFRLETKTSGKIYANDVIVDAERIQTERSTKEVQEIMKRILIT